MFYQVAPQLHQFFIEIQHFYYLVLLLEKIEDWDGEGVLVEGVSVEESLHTQYHKKQQMSKNHFHNPNKNLMHIPLPPRSLQ